MTEQAPLPFACATVQADLFDYADGALAAEAEAAITAHLDTCDRCRTEWDLLQALLEGLGRLPCPAPSSGLRERLLAQVTAETVIERIEMTLQQHGMSVTLRQRVVKEPLSARPVRTEAGVVLREERTGIVFRHQRETTVCGRTIFRQIYRT